MYLPKYRQIPEKALTYYRIIGKIIFENVVNKFNEKL